MKVFLKLISVFLLFGFFVGTAYFILFPHYGDMKLYQSQLKSYDVAYSFTLQLFTKVSPLTFDSYLADYDDQSTVEYLDPALLLQYMNEGKVTMDLAKKGTYIRIDSANIAGDIHDGENAETMMEGPWRFPLSKGPGEKGNMVIFGHRFAEYPPSTNTFFNLDKVKIGDKIIVEQNGGISYSYTVVSAQEVEKYDRSVLQSTGDHRITLVTCAPLWTSKRRLAVVGILDRAYKRI